MGRWSLTRLDERINTFDDELRTFETHKCCRILSLLFCGSSIHILGRERKRYSKSFPLHLDGLEIVKFRGSEMLDGDVENKETTGLNIR
jgi:hypothetical protein